MSNDVLTLELRNATHLWHALRARVEDIVCAGDKKTEEECKYLLHFVARRCVFCTNMLNTERNDLATVLLRRCFEPPFDFIGDIWFESDDMAAINVNVWTTSMYMIRELKLRSATHIVDALRARVEEAIRDGDKTIEEECNELLRKAIRCQAKCTEMLEAERKFRALLLSVRTKLLSVVGYDAHVKMD